MRTIPSLLLFSVFPGLICLVLLIWAIWADWRSYRAQPTAKKKETLKEWLERIDNPAR